MWSSTSSFQFKLRDNSCCMWYTACCWTHCGWRPHLCNTRSVIETAASHFSCCLRLTSLPFPSCIPFPLHNDTPDCFLFTIPSRRQVDFTASSLCYDHVTTKENHDSMTCSLLEFPVKASSNYFHKRVSVIFFWL